MIRRLAGVLLAGALASTAFGATSTAGGHDISVWLTDVPNQIYLSKQAGIDWRNGRAPAAQTIHLDERRTYQSMIGFGASFTDSSAWLVGTRLDKAQRDKVMRELFSPRDGIGLSFVRQPMGASDFAVNGNYSYDDMPAGQTDPTLANFSIDYDKPYIIPILKQAQKLNPKLTLMASPWSPPGWMKTTDSMIGGNLKPESQQPLADYFSKFLKAYKREGVPVDFISVNNEPLYQPPGYPGLGMSAEQANVFIRDYLGPTLKKRGQLSSTKILGYDHNWDVVTYPETLYADPQTSPYVYGTAWHCYGGDVRAQSMSHNSYPNKPAYHTECSGGEWEGDAAAGFRGGIGLVVNATRDWAKGVVRWNMALDQNNGPTNGGCPTCRGIVTVAPDAAGKWGYTKTVDYYALGHASKFVRVGAKRIASNTLGAENVQDVAFVNPDGSKVLIAYNAGTTARSFNVQFGSRWFAASLPAGGAATYTWSGSQRGSADASAIGSVDLFFRNGDGSKPVVSYDTGLLALNDEIRVGSSWVGSTLPGGASFGPSVPAVPLARDGWTVSASTSAADEPASRTIDGDPATRWSTGRGMEPGDWFQVDLGSEQTVSEFLIDATGSGGDFPRGYELFASTDGVTWGQPIARGGGRAKLAVQFPAVSARYLRIVNQGSAGSWWSIHELSVSAPGAGAASGSGSGGSGLQQKTATLSDGTKLLAIYNAGKKLATFDRQLGSSTWTYKLPASAVAIFTERAAS